MHDVVIIGGGHNGLVCSAYLAMAGFKIVVLDQRSVIGGAAVTEEFSPGFSNSVASYTVSLLNPKIIRDLDLAAHGLHIIERPISNFLPLEDGRFLKVGGGQTKQQVAKFSQRDADSLGDYQARLDAVADVLRATVLETPPNVVESSPFAAIAGRDSHDQIEDEADSAAAAFEDLRAEISVLRRAVEAMPASLRENRPPDYAPTLGAIVKAVQGVEKRLAGIEGHPAIKVTPEQHGRAIERAATNIMREPMETFRNEAAALGLERRQLGQIIGVALTQEAQRRWQLWFAGAGLALGLMLFPLIAAFAPGGSHLAALAAGETDRWQAGGALMREASPEGWREFVGGANLARVNADAIRVCREAAAKAGKEQKCIITVPSPTR